ncbi:MAG: ABC transporter permease subunit [Haloarculaceae archaeon]
MRWDRLARKNVGDARRSRSLYGVVGLFVLTGGLVGYLGSGASGNGSSVLSSTLGLMGFLVPVVALGLTYESVAGPRTDGSLQFLLALPYSRRDVVLGTYVGRIAVLAAGVCAGYIALAVAMLPAGVVVSPVTFVVVLAVILALSLAFVAIGVGISTGVRSTMAAGALAFGSFILAFIIWGSLPGLIVYTINGFSPPASPPDWAPLFRTLNPLTAFRVVASESIEGAGGVGSGVVQSLPLAVAVLAGWTTLAPLAGYLRFRSDDL